MKWINPGHEFDKIGHSLKNMENVYIYGAGFLGWRACETITSLSKWFKWKITFIDFNDEKQRSGFMGLRVLPQEALYTLDKSKDFVIVCVNEETLPVMIKIAEDAGFLQMQNLFDFESFFYKQLSIHYWYNLNMVCLYNMSIRVSTICNLNCNGCSAFMPHTKKHVIYELDSLYESIDLFFEKVDLVCSFALGGSEPLLYPNLAELIEYVGERYGDKIVSYELMSNGTIIPNDKLCAMFDKYKMRIVLSDYGKTVPLAKKNVDKTVAKLRSFDNIYTDRRSMERWYNFTPNLFNENEHTEEWLRQNYTDCGMCCRYLVNKTITSCAFSHFAEEAGLIKYCKDDYLDLSKINSSNKAELVEFACRFNTRGYVELCKHCVGLRNNRNYIEPAIQILRNKKFDVKEA